MEMHSATFFKKMKAKYLPFTHSPLTNQALLAKGLDIPGVVPKIWLLIYKSWMEQSALGHFLLLFHHLTLKTEKCVN